MRVINLLLILSVTEASGVAQLGRTGEKAEQKPEPTISRMIRVAKLEGKSSVILKSHRTNTPFKSFDELFESGSLIVVGIPGARLALAHESDSIVTWYKIRILEVLSGRLDSSSQSTAILPPHELLPVLESEVVLAVPGGSITLDGVTVTDEPDAELTLDRTYLLALYRAPREGFAWLTAKDRGVFLVDGTSSLSPVGPKDSPLAANVRVSYKSRLDLLRQDVQRRGIR